MRSRPISVFISNNFSSWYPFLTKQQEPRLNKTRKWFQWRWGYYYICNYCCSQFRFRNTQPLFSINSSLVPSSLSFNWSVENQPSFRDRWARFQMSWFQESSWRPPPPQSIARELKKNDSQTISSLPDVKSKVFTERRKFPGRYKSESPFNTQAVENKPSIVTKSFSKNSSGVALEPVENKPSIITRNVSKNTSGEALEATRATHTNGTITNAPLDNSSDVRRYHGVTVNVTTAPVQQRESNASNSSMTLKAFPTDSLPPCPPVPPNLGVFPAIIPFGLPIRRLLSGFYGMAILLTSFLSYTLSGRIGKVVASHAAVVRSIPAEVALIYTMHEVLRVYCPWYWGVRPVNWIYRLWRHCPSLVVVDWNLEFPIGLLQYITASCW